MSSVRIIAIIVFCGVAYYGGALIGNGGASGAVDGGGRSGDRLTALKSSAAASFRKQLDDLKAMANPLERERAAAALVAEVAKGDHGLALDLIRELAVPAGVRDRLFSDYVSEWASSDPAAAGAYALEVGDAHFRKLALEGVATEWAAADVSSAMAWALSAEVDRSEREVMMVRVVEGGTGNDLDATMVAVEGLSLEDLGLLVSNTREGRAPALAKLLASIGRNGEVGRAFEFLQGLPDSMLVQFFPDGKDGSRTTEFRELIRMDPDSALAIVSRLPEGSVGHSAVLVEALSMMAMTDIERASQLGAGLPAYSRRSFLYSALEKWKGEDLLGAANFMIENRDLVQGHEMYNLFSSLGVHSDEGIELGLELVERLPESAQVNSLAMVLAGMLRSDPLRAMELAAGSEYVLREVAGTWARTDADAYKAWLDSEAGTESLRAAWRFDELKNQVSKNFYGKDLTATSKSLAEAARLGLDEVQLGELGFAYRGTAQFLANQDLEGSVAWLLELGDSAAGGLAARAITEKAIAIDVARASEWIGQLPPGPSRDEAASLLARKLAASDPAGAFAWAAAIGGGSETAPGYENLLNVAMRASAMPFFRADPEVAVAQILDLPAGAARDRAAHEISAAIAEADAEAAFALGASLSDSKLAPISVTTALGFIDNRARREVLVNSLPDDFPQRSEIVKMYVD